MDLQIGVALSEGIIRSLALLYAAWGLGDRAGAIVRACAGSRGPLSDPHRNGAAAAHIRSERF
jgi:hypothetical protein